MNTATLLTYFAIGIVPALIAIAKLFLPNIPKIWLPTIAPFLGGLIAAIDGMTQSGALSGNHVLLGMVMGSAGVGLREILDQIGKLNAPVPPAATAALLFFLLPAFTLNTGCKSADATAYKTVASIEASADRAMSAWASYVVAQRGNPAMDQTQLLAQEQRVRVAYGAYRSAMNTVYSTRAVYLGDQASGATQLQAAVAAAGNAASSIIQIVMGIVPGFQAQVEAQIAERPAASAITPVARFPPVTNCPTCRIGPM